MQLQTSISGSICATLLILSIILFLFHFEKDNISFKLGMFIPRFPGVYDGESKEDIFKRGHAFFIKNNKLLFCSMICSFMSGLNMLLFFIPVIWSEYFGYKENETYKLIMYWWKIYFLSYLPIGFFCILFDRLINGPVTPGRNTPIKEADVGHEDERA